MKKSSRVPKLNLRKETLQQLNREVLKDVAGASVTCASYTCSNNSCYDTCKVF